MSYPSYVYPPLPPPPLPPTKPPVQESPSNAMKRPHQHEEGSENEVASKKPKTQMPHHSWPFLNAWLKSFQDPLPYELLKQCKPLYCDLCNVKMNSPQQAKIHYDGKIHDKHARHFLARWAQDGNGQIPRKVGSSNDVTANLQPLRCDTCNLNFTSKANLDQHAAGRNHIRMVSGLSQLKPGYFNKTTGKWQRHPTEQTLHEESMSNPNLQAIPMIDTTGSTIKPHTGPFFCNLCQVAATSQDQLDMHLAGKNHKKKLKRQVETVSVDGLAKPIINHPTSSSSARAAIVKNKLTADSSKRDYSIFRTPSGLYYCQSCNITVNSEHQFVQHLDSKKHKTKGKKK